jgi:hypothetical protein
LGVAAKCSCFCGCRVVKIGRTPIANSVESHQLETPGIQFRISGLACRHRICAPQLQGSVVIHQMAIVNCNILACSRLPHVGLWKKKWRRLPAKRHRKNQNSANKSVLGAAKDGFNTKHQSFKPSMCCRLIGKIPNTIFLCCIHVSIVEMLNFRIFSSLFHNRHYWGCILSSWRFGQESRIQPRLGFAGCSGGLDRVRVMKAAWRDDVVQRQL